MAEPTLDAAATRLGSVYAELINAGHALDATSLPRWIEPERLRPAGGFGIGSKLQLALGRSPLYFGQLGDAARRRAGYPNLEFDNLRASLFQYEQDLRVFYGHLKPALARYTQEALKRQEEELRKLHSRFGKPGIEDELHASFLRLWPLVQEVLPGGSRPQSVEDRDPGTAAKDKSDAPTPTEITSEILPGGMAGPVDLKASEQTVPQKERPTDFIEPNRMRRAIKTERELLESEVAEESDAQKREVIELLAAIAVHPAVVEIARNYVWSPLKGTEYTQGAIELAVEAVADLRERLVQREPDDAWNYAPLVVGAIAQLKLQELPAVPEFGVALGMMLGRTRTDIYLGVASTLVVGLTLAFTGPVGGVAAGLLDLALAGTSLGITRLRAHEQEIAATASDFSPGDQKLADHASGFEGGLDAAGALLSALLLAGSIRELMKARELIALNSKGVRVIRTPPKPPARQELSALEKGEQTHPFVQKSADRINGKPAAEIDPGTKNKGTADRLGTRDPVLAVKPAPVDRSAEIEKMIADELEGYVPPAFDSPTELSGTVKGNQRAKVSEISQVDMSDLKQETLAAYEKRYPDYVKAKKAANQPFMDKDTYVHFRHGTESGQLVREVSGPANLSRTGAIEQLAGYELERVVDQRLPKGSANNTSFPNPYGEERVKPDHIPRGEKVIRIDSSGRQAPKGQLFSAKFVGDSKYVEMVPITDQTRGFVNYARLSDEKTLVFYVRWQQKFPGTDKLIFDASFGGYVLPPRPWNAEIVAPGLREFAGARNVKIRLVSDPLWK